MGATRIDHLHPLTVESIMAARVPDCGCVIRGEWVFLCYYHEGFDEGVSAQRARAAENSSDAAGSETAWLSDAEVDDLIESEGYGAWWLAPRVVYLLALEVRAWRSRP